MVFWSAQARRLAQGRNPLIQGGWLMNNRTNPPLPPVLMPNARICGGNGSPWLRFTASSAPITFPVPAQLAPPRSARNSRRREKKNPIPESARSFLSSTRSTTPPMMRARNMTKVCKIPCSGQGDTARLVMMNGKMRFMDLYLWETNRNMVTPHDDGRDVAAQFQGAHLSILDLGGCLRPRPLRGRSRA